MRIDPVDSDRGHGKLAQVQCLEAGVYYDSWSGVDNTGSRCVLLCYDLVVGGLDFDLVGASRLSGSRTLNSHEMNRELCTDRNSSFFKRFVNFDCHCDSLTIDPTSG